MGDDMIDWSRVSELRDEVGEEDFAEVVDLFLEEVEEVIGELPALPDDQSVMQHLHFLKGSALSLGFAGFSDRCTQAERACAAGVLTPEELAAVQDCHAASKALFLREKDARIAA